MTLGLIPNLASVWSSIVHILHLTDNPYALYLCFQKSAAGLVTQHFGHFLSETGFALISANFLSLSVRLLLTSLAQSLHLDAKSARLWRSILKNSLGKTRLQRPHFLVGLSFFCSTKAMLMQTTQVAPDLRVSDLRLLLVPQIQIQSQCLNLFPL